MTGALRLFVAVDVPPGHLARVEALTNELDAALSGARLVPRGNQHITLKFFGATAPDRLEAVKEVCATAAASRRAANVSLSGFGGFPSSRRIRVLWVGIDDPSHILELLASALDRAGNPLGFPVEERAFTPHLTVARFKVPARFEGPLPRLSVSDLAPLPVDRLALYHSRLSPKGATYERLETFALA
ncbi:MAG: RNA 2',3'-cyclic phosphodiesterase [Actinomycetota bacterium]|nr:RNA 2',3'-cyclic phosphodiesterase [Actinomycetota bacterium]